LSAIRIAAMFDMRAREFGTPRRDLYAAALDMAAYADQIGVTRVNLMEHHGSDDSYLPTPFAVGGGVAVRTKSCRITSGAVVLPLYDPVKVAEQIAGLDITAGDRLDQGIDIILCTLRGDGK